MKLDDLPLHELRGTGEQVQAIQFPMCARPTKMRRNRAVTP